jgi:hypothetical protein
MNADDRTMKIVIQMLHDWWASMGELAWVLLGVLLLVGIAVMVALLRWVWSGGLSRQTRLALFRQGRGDCEHVASALDKPLR